MVGQHRQLVEHEFEQGLGDSEGQGSLACYSPWDHKESDMTQQLNNNWTFHLKAAEYTFFSSAHKHSPGDYILGHKSSLSKFNKIEIISSIFSDHNAETRYQLQEQNCKKHKHMEIKQYVSK